jgi:metal-responsive CopG/Arc/MetJ family transcriptional regulator
MTKPTTIRLPEDLIEEIDQFVQEGNLEKAYSASKRSWIFMFATSFYIQDL